MSYQCNFLTLRHDVGAVTSLLLANCSHSLLFEFKSVASTYLATTTSPQHQHLIKLTLTLSPLSLILLKFSDTEHMPHLT